MNNIASKAKLAVSFLCGALLVNLTQGTKLNASTTAPSGSCVMLGNYSGWGWAASIGTNKEWNELAIINFDQKTASVIVNSVTAGTPKPLYEEGSPEKSSFTLSDGPLAGTYKMNFAKEYVIIAPANGGNTIFLLDSLNGMTGVCQKI